MASPHTSVNVSAEAILKSRTGRSLNSPAAAITSENVEDFTPAPETVAEATGRLRELGFSVAPSGVTLTLLGEHALFEEVFQVKLTPRKDEETRATTVHPEGEPRIPDSLRGIVEKVVFPEPPELFP